MHSHVNLLDTQTVRTADSINMRSILSIDANHIDSGFSILVHSTQCTAH